MKKIYVAGLFTGLFCLLSAVFAVPAHAVEPQGVYISEINWGGSSVSTADEWIELFNPNGESVDIGGWILTGSATSGDAFALAEDTFIEAESTLLIANYDLGHEKTTLNVQPNLVTSSLSIPNSDLDILLTDPTGMVVDEVYISGRPDVGATEPHTSMERNLELGAWQSAAESIGLLDEDQLGTPGIVKNEVNEEVTEVEEVIEEHEEVAEEPPADMCWCPCMENTDDTDEITEIIDSDLDNSPPDIGESEGANDAPIETVNDEPEPEPEPEPVNETPAPMSYVYHAVLINEFVSDPEDGIEWIELWNPGLSDILLDDWSVTDATGRETVLEGTLEAESYFVIEQPNGQLNNGGDTIELFDATANKIDAVTYGDELPAPEKGESLARNDTLQWQITTLITKQAQNAFNSTYEDTTTSQEVDTIDAGDDSNDSTEIVATVGTRSTDDETPSDVSAEREPFRVVAIAHAAELDEAESTDTTKKTSTTTSQKTMTGIITAEPEIFGSQIAYIPGAQLYFYYADWPKLTVGDLVTVSGEETETRGEARLKISSAKDITVTGHEALEPQDILATNLDSTPTGSLVRIKGTVVARDGDELTVEDDSGEVTVIANKKTGMVWTNVASTDVNIVGIVRHVNGNPRLYPRTMADIEERVSSVTKTETDTIAATQPVNWKPWVGGTLLLIALGAMTYWYAQFKKSPILSPTTSH